MKLIKTIPILALAIAMVSCSGTKSLVDTNDKTDFSKYETYNFQGWQMNSDELLTDEDKELLRDAFVKEFERRGLKRVNVNGNMQVTLYIVVNKKTAYSGYNDYVGNSASGWGYGYGYGYGQSAYGYGGGGYGTSGNSYKQRDKLMGTLIMSVFDGKYRKSDMAGSLHQRCNQVPEKTREIHPFKSLEHDEEIPCSA